MIPGLSGLSHKKLHAPHVCGGDPIKLEKVILMDKNKLKEFLIGDYKYRSVKVNGHKKIKLDASPGLIPVVLFAAAIIKFLTSEDD